ncbi:MAG: leucyl aminopeptidase, partial [Pseudomonadota bacterium]
MTTPATVTFATIEPETAAARTGELAMLVGADRKLDAHARALDARTGGALARFVESEAFEKLSVGGVHSLSYPANLEATALHVVKLERDAEGLEARAAGAALGKARGEAALTVLASRHVAPDEIAYGASLRDYAFIDHKTGKDRSVAAGIAVLVDDAARAEAAFADKRALAESVFFARDLVNAPANVLTTSTFADRLADLRKLGLSVEVLEEDALEQLGMRTLLAVGQGSDSPSKVVVMQWNGGGTEAPLVLAGKGVVFDTGGISLKPAAGMEDMTLDMGGAGTVSGVMKALALRKARANVVGLVGLVENMPDGKAFRPGDVIVSMKGDTIEIINTDAEGRLVLADVLWYAQERFEPVGMINLATLTGAIIIGLGHEMAG